MITINPPPAPPAGWRERVILENCQDPLFSDVTWQKVEWWDKRCMLFLMIPSTQASLQRNRNNWMIWNSLKEKGLPEDKHVLRHTVSYRTCLPLYVSYHIMYDMLIFLCIYLLLKSCHPRPPLIVVLQSPAWMSLLSSPSPPSVSCSSYSSSYKSSWSSPSLALQFDWFLCMFAIKMIIAHVHHVSS